MSDSRRTFILVHGAWGCGGEFAELATLLALKGHVVLTPDLPGHGLGARYPSSYWARPFDPAAFAVEPSPLADITLADYVGHIGGLVERALAAGNGPVTLVGSSMAGIVLNAVGEALGPVALRRLVYVSALMPPSSVPAIALTTAPSQATSVIHGLFAADPQAVGCLRVDFADASPEGLNARLASYNDVPAARARAALRMSSCDEPAAPFLTPIELTATRWGAIPRTFVLCTLDRVFLPATARDCIAAADRLNTANPTEVVEVPAGHFAHLSQPEAIADILLAR